MAERPSRAKMCSWLSDRLVVIQVLPYNPADINAITRMAREAQRDVKDLSWIAAEMGWHVDASLDYAWELMQEYDARKAGSGPSSGV